MDKLHLRDKIFRKFPILKTKGLVLREITAKDKKDMFHYLSDKNVYKYLDVDFKTFNQVDDLIIISQSRFKNKSQIKWGITLNDDKIIGTVTFFDWNLWFDKIKIGYDLSRVYWRRGIMSEALKELLKFGFQKMKLNRVEEKRKRGILREKAFYRKKFHDVKIFSILGREFQGMKIGGN